MLLADRYGVVLSRPRRRPKEARHRVQVVIDLKLLREDPGVVRRSQRSRGEDAALVDALLEADVARRAAIAAADTLRAEQKAASKSVGAATPQDRPALLERAKQLAAGVKDAEATQAQAERVFNAAHLAIPNVVIDGVPAGGEDDYRVLDVVGEPRPIENPRDHLELGEALGLIDMERGAKVSGSRFYFLTGHGALLQLGLLQLAVRLATANGFTLMIPPVLVRPEVMAGTGFLGSHADEIYHLPDDDLYLVGTSEVPLAGYHADEILDLSDGPKRYAGWSSCFRREAGSYGKDTRGIIRVHQFDKVEAFVYCRPEDAEAEHQRLLGWQREMLELIEVPYRVIDVAAGDLGAPEADALLKAGVPRTDLDIELHDVPGAPAGHPVPRRERQAADRRHPQRHAGHHPVAGRDSGKSSAAGRNGAGTCRVGAVLGDRGAGTVMGVLTQ